MAGNDLRDIKGKWTLIKCIFYMYTGVLPASVVK